MPNDADWFGGWAADGPDSNWVTQNAQRTNNGENLPITYSVQFYLADTAAASLSGSWGIDDSGFISLNGHQLDAQGCCGFPHTVGDSVVSDFNAGLNTLSIVMTGSDDFLEAVRFEGAVTGDGATFSATPEPATVLLVLGAISGCAARRRRATR